VPSLFRGGNCESPEGTRCKVQRTRRGGVCVESKEEDICLYWAKGVCREMTRGKLIAKQPTKLGGKKSSFTVRREKKRYARPGVLGKEGNVEKGVTNEESKKGKKKKPGDHTTEKGGKVRREAKLTKWVKTQGGSR